MSDPPGGADEPSDTRHEPRSDGAWRANWCEQPSQTVFWRPRCSMMARSLRDVRCEGRARGHCVS